MALVLVSCGKRSLTASEVVFDKERVYADGALFTGTVSSEAPTTWELTVEEGVPTAVSFFHANGTVAYSMSSPTDTTSIHLYEDDGTEIPLDSFVERHKDLAAQIPALLQLIKGDGQQSPQAP